MTAPPMVFFSYWRIDKQSSDIDLTYTDSRLRCERSNTPLNATRARQVRRYTVAGRGTCEKYKTFLTKHMCIDVNIHYLLPVASVPHCRPVCKTYLSITLLRR